MRLVDNRGQVVEDPFARIAADAPIPQGAAAIVAAERLAEAAAAAAERGGRLGVIWPNHRPVAELAPYLDRLSLIGLVFPTFKDGRAYSQARLLRERHGFRGELRATGQVLRDQFLFMLRAGFDSFEVTKEADAAAFGESIRRYGIFFQPTGDGRATARDARLEGVALSPDDRDGPTGW
jgi:uncharacterized protein (DUF934 family)